jgi:hypothetical protein
VEAKAQCSKARNKGWRSVVLKQLNSGGILMSVGTSIIFCDSRSTHYWFI